MGRELPSDVLRELREKKGLARKAFGELTGWSYEIQRNLEANRTRFTRQHLEELVAAGWIKEGDEFYRRFEEAMAYAWEAERKRGEREERSENTGETNHRPLFQVIIFALFAIVIVIVLTKAYLNFLERKASLNNPKPSIAEMPLQQRNVQVSAKALARTIPPTYTPLPTHTPPPTYTPLPTQTIPPTYTPLPTYTPYPTPTKKRPSPTPSNTPLPEVTLPFEDNFDNGLRPEWKVQDGDWMIVNGALTLTDDDQRFHYIYVGDPNWGNYAVDVDVISTDPYMTIGILVRASDDGEIQFLTSQVWESEMRYLLQGKKRTIAESSEAPPPGEKPYHIRVEAKGDCITAYINGKKILSVIDSRFKRGRVGLACGCRDASCHFFDNFKVTPLD